MIENKKLDSGKLLVSYNVTSPVTNIPLQQTLDIAK